ncbi:MAG: cell wall hydrolase [Rhodospirillales bacterium]
MRQRTRGLLLPVLISLLCQVGIAAVADDEIDWRSEYGESDASVSEELPSDSDFAGDPGSQADDAAVEEASGEPTYGQAGYEEADQGEPAADGETAWWTAVEPDADESLTYAQPAEEGAAEAVQLTSDTGLHGGPSGGLSAEDREAIGRIAYAEAGNQGEEGIAAVIYTILNRVSSGQFQSTVQGVIDAPNQFEPATRAGGWRNLPSLTQSQRIQYETILNLILASRLPDLTNGALFFQNARIVAERAAAGSGSSYLVDFGGTPPIAEIRDHRFYDARAAVNLAAGRWRGAAGASRETSAADLAYDRGYGAVYGAVGSGDEPSAEDDAAAGDSPSPGEDAWTRPAEGFDADGSSEPSS